MITGATGFVGSHVLRSLMAIQHQQLEIVAACREPSRLPSDYRGEIRLGDLRDPDYLDRLLVGVDVVCHTAGFTDFSRAKTPSHTAYLEPSLELIERCLEWRISRFVNLSSLAVARPSQRNNAEAVPCPQRHWPMLNGLIAIEEYLKAQAKPGFQVINLRLGIYCGQGMHLGLMPTLLSRADSPWVPHISGNYGHLPLVDGKDIGQAFARAALVPDGAFFESINICGPETPSQQLALEFLQQHAQHAYSGPGLPGFLIRPYGLMLAGLKHRSGQPLFPGSLLYLMTNPLINNEKASYRLGYDPKISWQASLLDLLDEQRKSRLIPPLSQTLKSLNIS